MQLQQLRDEHQHLLDLSKDRLLHASFVIFCVCVDDFIDKIIFFINQLLGNTSFLENYMFKHAKFKLNSISGSGWNSTSKQDLFAKKHQDR